MSTLLLPYVGVGVVTLMEPYYVMPGDIIVLP